MTASVRRERQIEQPRQQARAPASEPCSSRAAVHPKRAVSTPQSRCSPGLHPLRGLPAPPHGPKSSPHVVTAGRRRDRSRDVCPRQPPETEASKRPRLAHYRVSIRRGLEAPTRAAPTSLRFATFQPLEPPSALQNARSLAPPEDGLKEDPSVTNGESPGPTEVNRLLIAG